MNKFPSVIFLMCICMGVLSCNKISTEAISVENELTPVLDAIKLGEKKSIVLIGKLDLTPTTKKLAIKQGSYTPAITIGDKSLPLAHGLNKMLYHNQTVLIKADICHCPVSDMDVKAGHWIVNVRHIEIVKSP